MANPTISQVKLPSGNLYDIVDSGARDLISAINNWTYVVSTNAATTPKDVTWKDGSTTITGTLVASASTEYKIYLVPATTTSGQDIKAEYITVKTGSSSYIWEKMGDTEIDIDNLGAFAYADTGTVTIKPKGSTSSSSVSFAAHTTAKVLTSSVTATVPKNPTATVKHLTASASGGAVGVATSGSAITSLGAASTATFVQSYPGSTSKLSTTSVTGVTSSTTTASKATAGTAVAVAKAGTATTVATGGLGSETTSSSANTLMYSASVSDGVLSFSFKPLSTTTVTPAVSNGTITPYTFTDVAVPVKASSATTVATGGLSATGGGSTVMTGLGTAVTGTGVTGYASPSTETFAKTVSMTAQPSVTLSAAASSSSGSIKFTEDISSSGTDSVTFDTTTAGKTANAITALGAATAAGQTLTGTTETYTVNPA